MGAYGWRAEVPMPAGAKWQIESERSGAAEVAGVVGTVCETVFAGPLGRCTRRIVECPDGITFFQLVWENTGAEPIAPGQVAVVRLAPIASDCDIYCRKRYKMDMPEGIRLRELAEEAEASADDLMAVCGGGGVLIAGFIEQHRQHGRIRLTSAEGGARSVVAECSFDTALLMPGKRISTQYFALIRSAELNEGMIRHDELVRRFYDLPAPGRPPVVASTWHYYSNNISIEVVKRELAAIRARRVPAQVYQLDAGWFDEEGDWNAVREKFPNGMEEAAEAIRAAGLIPGLWFAPFKVAPTSKLAAEHPEWLLLHDGEPILYTDTSRPCFTLDPTHPEAEKFVEELGRRYRRKGFDYFKIDFTRFITMQEGVPLYDREKTTVEACRIGYAAFRRGIGSDAHLNICGGHYLAGIGIQDSARNGSDTYGRWDEGGMAERVLHGVRRAYQGRWWNADPDGMAFRLCDKPEPSRLSWGTLTWNECRCVAAGQLVTGGIIQYGDPLGEVTEERLELMRKVTPSVDSRPILLNPFHRPDEAECFLNRITAPDGSVWHILSALNVTDHEVRLNFDFGALLAKWCGGGELLWFDAVEFRFEGVLDCSALPDFGTLPRRDARMWKLLKLDAAPEPHRVFVADDRHFACGLTATWRELPCGGLEVTVPDPSAVFPLRVAAATVAGGRALTLEERCAAPGAGPATVTFE